VSAVEALCEQTKGSKEYQQTITELEGHLGTLSIDSDTREDVVRRLQLARRQTIRQAYLGKFRALLGPDQARAFDRLYGRRGEFLHEGQGRGDLHAGANEARDLATRLLEAELLG
jgi:hypothetical protein